MKFLIFVVYSLSALNGCSSDKDDLRSNQSMENSATNQDSAVSDEDYKMFIDRLDEDKDGQVSRNEASVLNEELYEKFDFVDKNNDEMLDDYEMRSVSLEEIGVTSAALANNVWLSKVETCAIQCVQDEPGEYENNIQARSKVWKETGDCSWDTCIKRSPIPPVGQSYPANGQECIEPANAGTSTWITSYSGECPLKI